MSEVEDMIGEQSTESQQEEVDAAPKNDTKIEDELVNEEVTGETESMVTETIDEDGDVVEETTEVTRKVVKRTMKITEESNLGPSDYKASGLTTAPRRLKAIAFIFPLMSTCQTIKTFKRI